MYTIPDILYLVFFAGKALLQRKSNICILLKKVTKLPQIALEKETKQKNYACNL